MSATGQLALLIEDNPVNLELLTCLMAALGYRTVSATDGERGLAAAREHHPSLILCDIQMPGMDGLQFARHAKADPALCRIPLVALTALAMVGDRERILSAGFDGYLAKPIDPMRFADSVRPWLAAPPPAPRAASPDDAAQAPPPRPAPHRGLILVVDDTDFNLVLKRDLLEPHGYAVVTASDAVAALQLVRRQLPDLVVSDVGMRPGNGLDLLRALRADAGTCQVPVVFTSATHWDQAVERQALALGAAAYLRRPMDPARFLAVLAQCLQR
ncbi:response regulator [Ideonella sp. 4Y11]|uniref:Response regulator n=1 Tax=Ideonella aquatica TaxID=2824119 RepID=A0A941BLM7_9BURK|nr:response regulator [Ideonella aquatica]MBQ0959864.1 response regulator [Ideonella aquatica]